MIQGLSQLTSAVELIKLDLDGKVQIQKIQSTPTTFCLRLRLMGKTCFYHIGRGRGVEGLWVTDKPPEVNIRIKDKFDDWLKKNLKNSMLKSIETHAKYRAIKFGLLNRESEDSFFFYYKGRRLYFAFFSKKKESTMFKSWIGKKEIFREKEDPTLETVFGDLLSGSVPSEKKSTIGLLEHYKSLRKTKKNSRKLKLLKRKLSELKSKLVMLSEAEAKQLYISTFEFKEIEELFKSIKIKLAKKPRETIHQFRNRAFTKIKNFRGSREFTLLKVAGLEKEIENLPELIELKKVNLPEWYKFNKKIHKDIRFFSIDGIKGAMGKNAKGNDLIRGQFGNSQDMWFHLDGDKSSHLILKSTQEGLTEKILEVIASMIRDNTRLSMTEINLIASELGGVRGVSGRAGAVTIRKPRYFKLLYNSSWKEIISED